MVTYHDLLVSYTESLKVWNEVTANNSDLENSLPKHRAELELIIRAIQIAIEKEGEYFNADSITGQREADRHRRYNSDD